MKKEELLDNVLNNLYKSTLKVPILNNYKIIPEIKNDYLIFTAVAKDNSIEQFLTDGILDEDESFEERLVKVIDETKKEMINNGLEKNDLEYIGALKNNLFKFHIFIQDNIKDNKVIRQINAYFLEPEDKAFYEISLIAPPMFKDNINENVSNNLNKKLRTIIKNISYNESNPIK